MKGLLSAPLSSRKLIEYLLLFLLLALVIGAAAYGGYWYGKQQVITPPQAVAPKAKEPTPQKPADETAGWRTYSNSDFGFKFKYPPKYTLEVTDRCRQPSGVEAWCQEVAGDLSLKFSYGSYWEGFDTVFYKNVANLSVRQWLDNKIAEDKIKYAGGPYPVPESSEVVLKRVAGLENETYDFQSAKTWPAYVGRIVKAEGRIITFQCWQNGNPEPSATNELGDRIYNTFSFSK